MQIKLPNGMVVEDASRAGALAVYEEIFEHKCYGRHGLKFQDKDLIFDFGANIGLFPLWLNTILKQAEVHAFEPVPHVFSMLCHNLAHNDTLDTVPHLHGILDRRCTRRVHVSHNLSQVSTEHGWSAAQRQANLDYTVRRIQRYAPLPAVCLRWLARLILKGMMKEVEVWCRFIGFQDLIDSFLYGTRWKDFRTVNFLKIDVEGSELAILSCLRRSSPIQQIAVEVHEPRELTLIEDLLVQAGFSVEIGYNPVFPTLPMLYARR